MSLVHRRRWVRAFLRPLAGVLFVAVIGTAEAAQVSFAITTDTYVDSRISNTGKNYGSATTVRAVVNSSDASVTRGLFALPPELNLYTPEQVLEAVISFYVWQDNTGSRNVTLYPLTRPFIEGTGNGTAPADGATWYTYDGTHDWTTPGGDYDTNYPVIGVKGPILDTNQNDRFFYWDITSLLTNAVARSNLVNNGAMLQIDELPIPPSGTPRAPFTSSDDAGYAAEYRPRLSLIIAPQTIDVMRVTMEADALVIAVTNCTPFVTNRIEYTLDLAQGESWTALTHVVSTGTTTNWVVPVPTNWPQAYYRIVADP